MRTMNELTLKDRCDRCGAAAKVMAVKNELNLLFCNHHFAKHVEKLLEEGWELYQNQEYRIVETKTECDLDSIQFDENGELL